MIIDTHVHIFPDEIAERAVESLATRAHVPAPRGEATLARLLTSMDAAAIARCWVASVATKPSQAGPILEWSKRLRSPRVVPLGSVHPDSTRWGAELAQIAGAGIIGIKLHPQYQGFTADDPKLFALYREAARLGLFALFHAGYDLAFRDDDRAAPARLARVHAEVPELTMIAAHLGGWMAWDEVIDCLVGTQVFLDTSFAHQASDRQREHIFRHHDRARILFGSDYPWSTQRESLSRLHDFGLDPESLQRILYRNAADLEAAVHRRVVHVAP